MTYEKALEIIESEFETRNGSPLYKVIKTGMTYDGCTGFFVCIYNSERGVILTDMGETKEFFDRVGEDEWKELCIGHGFRFVHYSITREFTKTQDVYDFINFLNLISDKYWEDCID
jgi:hypothetical protein